MYSHPSVFGKRFRVRSPALVIASRRFLTCLLNSGVFLIRKRDARQPHIFVIWRFSPLRHSLKSMERISRSDGDAEQIAAPATAGVPLRSDSWQSRHMTPVVVNFSISTSCLHFGHFIIRYFPLRSTVSSPGSGVSLPLGAFSSFSRAVCSQRRQVAATAASASLGFAKSTR